MKEFVGTWKSCLEARPGDAADWGGRETFGDEGDPCPGPGPPADLLDLLVDLLDLQEAIPGLLRRGYC